MRRHVYLVPGFFGFTELGDMNYFHGVSTMLAEALGARGVEADIFDCTTKPTASIPRRAEALIDEVAASGGLEADELHFVGHSTGGLDLRLLLTPGVRLREDDSDDRIGAMTRSCVTVSTPHFGTPLAGFFTTLPGRHMLEALALLATTSGGRYALFGASRALRALARWDDYLGRTDTLLDVWARRALASMSAAEDDPMWEFMREVSRDQGAIIQLTPESMNLFNAAVVDRDTVHYGSVISTAPPPPRAYGARQFFSPTNAALRTAFIALWVMASREHRHYPYPHPGEDVLDAYAEQVGFEITRKSNDGIVPALSQIYGDVLGVAVADHLDVVGQYDTGEPHSDWLPSGSKFDRAGFHASWDWIADAIAGATTAG